MSFPKVVLNRPPGGFALHEQYNPRQVTYPDSLLSGMSVVMSLHAHLVDTPMTLTGYRVMIGETLPGTSAYENVKYRVALYRGNVSTGIPAQVVPGSATNSFCPRVSGAVTPIPARIQFFDSYFLDVSLPAPVDLVPGPYHVAVLVVKPTDTDLLAMSGSKVLSACRDMIVTSTAVLPTTGAFDTWAFPSLVGAQIASLFQSQMSPTPTTINPACADWCLVGTYR